MEDMRSATHGPYHQIKLWPTTEATFPSTRYQGSKVKLVDWIWHQLRDIQFDSALDAFGGTGAAAYRLKLEGKRVIYNDLLRFNHQVGLALIENDNVQLSHDDVSWLLTRHPQIQYSTFIADTFNDIYYMPYENEWLDYVTTNISLLRQPYKQAIAFFALGQACIIKRPYNLFHRKNLYMRTASVERSFGNKTTWDTPFEEWFIKFIDEANAAFFSNGQSNVALRKDVFELETEADLVYIDTPYISGRGVAVDYLDFYHFLEGLVRYEEWPSLVDYKRKHRPFKRIKSPWTDRGKIHEAFDRLFRQFSESILVVSYRHDGIPSPQELSRLMRKYKRNVELLVKDYRYVLSNGRKREILLIGT